MLQIQPGNISQPPDIIQGKPDILAHILQKQLFRLIGAIHQPQCLSQLVVLLALLLLLQKLLNFFLVNATGIYRQDYRLDREVY